MDSFEQFTDLMRPEDVAIFFQIQSRTSNASASTYDNSKHDELSHGSPTNAIMAHGNKPPFPPDTISPLFSTHNPL